MERERERRFRQRECARRLAIQRMCEREEMRRQRQKRCHGPRRGFSSGFSDPFFDLGFMRLDRPLKSRAMPRQEAEEEEKNQHLRYEEEEEEAAEMHEHKSMDNISDSDEDAEILKEQPNTEQDKMFAYMTDKIRSMRRRRKSDADFNPEALLNLAESELNWLMEHEALRCEENAQENNNELVDKEAYRKLVLAFLRVYICENILDAISRDNFPPKPEDENENEAVGETEDGDGSQYYVLDVERRRKLHRLAARLEKEFE